MSDNNAQVINLSTALEIVRQLEKHPGEGLAVIDARTMCIMRCNEAYARHFDPDISSAEALTGCSILELLPDFEMHGFMEAARWIASERKPYRVTEFPHHLHGHETVSYWNIYIVPVEQDNEIVAFFAAIVDVTSLVQARQQVEAARRQAECQAEELKRQTRLIEAVFENAGVGLAYLDPAYNFIRVNSVYAANDERAVSDYPGRNLFDMYSSEEGRGVFDSLQNAGTPVELKEEPFLSPDDPESK